MYIRNNMCMQRWHCLCSQASKQWIDINVMNQQVIIDSKSNVTAL